MYKASSAPRLTVLLNTVKCASWFLGDDHLFIDSAGYWYVSPRIYSEWEKEGLV